MSSDHWRRAEALSARRQACGKRRAGGPVPARRPVRRRRRDAVGQAHRQGLGRAHRAAGKNHVERPAHAHDARQAHRAAVDQRHAPAAAEHAEHRVFVGHAQVGQQREFEPAGHRVAVHRRDQRLRQRHARRAHRAAAATFQVEFVAPVRVAHGGEVGARAEVAARAGQHRHAQRIVGLEALEGRAQLGGHGAVDGIALVGTVQRDGEDRAVCLAVHVLHGHARRPFRAKLRE